MKTQNIAQALGAIALIAALATPVLAQNAVSRTRTDDASVPTSPGSAATPTANTTPTHVGPTEIAPNSAADAAILPPPDRSTPAGGTISGSLDVSHAVSAIEGVSSDQRQKLLGEIAGRETSVDQQISSLKEKATNVKPDVRDAINSAWSDYQKAKSRLDQSIEKARKTAGTNWEDFRSELAADYAFFASAVAGLEVAMPNS